jgi:hemerythrin-like domain-containing protein
MPVQIGQKKESDFNDPLGLLSDCHRRIERFLGVLIQICQKRNGDTMTADERSSLENALNYFRNSAPKHTADEEESLFPRMRATAGADAALECLARLEGDHQTAGRDHEIVDVLATEWLRVGTLTTDQSRELNEAVARLSSLYARHIAIEDSELFPLAGRMLDGAALNAVGQEMADRRGIATGAGPKTDH